MEASDWLKMQSYVNIHLFKMNNNPPMKYTPTCCSLDISSDISITNTLYYFSMTVVGWLCFMSHRQRGHLETALQFTVPCEGRVAGFSRRSHRGSNPGCPVAVHYTTAAPCQLH